MAEILFKRTLHPVGHGAFFTEQFCYGDIKRSFLNVVYDCGSFDEGPRKVPKILKDAFYSAFDYKGHIDIIFISHFDGDHINGIEFILKQEHSYIDNRTIVVVPFKYPLILHLLEGSYRRVGRLIQKLVNKNVVILGIDNEIQMGEGQELSIEKLYEQKTIRNGTILYNDLWYYVPFIVKSTSNYLDKVIQKIRSCGLNESALYDGDYIRKNIEKIKEAAKVGNAKTINMHSLQLISFGRNQHIQYINGYYVERLCLCCHNGWIMNSGQPHGNHNSSCLYTGDADLHNENYDYDMQFVKHILNRYSNTSLLGLMQIPHHGSSNNYPQFLVEEPMVISAFVNFDANYKQRIFDFIIPRKFASKEKPLYLVTNNIRSRFVMQINNVNDKKQM